MELYIFVFAFTFRGPKEPLTILQEGKKRQMAGPDGASITMVR